VKIQAFIETNRGFARGIKSDLAGLKFELRKSKTGKLSQSIMYFTLKINLECRFKEIETLIFLN
jgi:hypothetical protein